MIWATFTIFFGSCLTRQHQQVGTISKEYSKPLKISSLLVSLTSSSKHRYSQRRGDYGQSMESLKFLSRRDMNIFEDYTLIIQKIFQIKN